MIVSGSDLTTSALFRSGSTAAKDPSMDAGSGPGHKAVIQIAQKAMPSMAENGQQRNIDNLRL